MNQIDADTTIVVYSPDMNYIIGIGKIVGYENLLGLNLDIETPKIELTTGRIIYGCECWWEPLIPTGDTCIHGE